MSEYHEDIVHDEGFSSGHGHFKAWPGGMERIKGSRLRRMFLPRLSREAKRALQQNRQFVRCHLKHYGIRFSEEEYSGNGTQLLQKFLRDGKCDEVPPIILRLECWMHRKWLSKCEPSVLIKPPDWLMVRHFLANGRPDHLRTPCLVKITPPDYGTHGPDGIIEATGRVTGLHCQKAVGPKTHVVFMGWNAVSVQEGVESHITEEKTEMHFEEPKRIFVAEMKRRAEEEKMRAEEEVKRAEEEKKRAEEEKRRRHRQQEQIYADNLDILMRETGNNISSISMPTRLPIDSYDVYCEKLEGQWKKHDFTIDIEKTATPGLLEAAFDFGVVEGIMIICGSQSRLKECRDRAYRGKNPYQYPFPEVNDDLSNAFSSSSSGSSSNPSGGDSGVSNEKHHQPGSKRKSEDERPTTEIKGAKKGQGLPYKYPLMLRCREMYQQEILYNPEMGKTMFKDGNFDCFTGIVNLPDDFGRNVVFYALKVSHEPQSFNKQWSDYSEEQWEFECRDRYRRR